MEVEGGTRGEAGGASRGRAGRFRRQLGDGKVLCYPTCGPKGKTAARS